MALCRVAAYTLSRNSACAYACVGGVALGCVNAQLDVDFALRPALFVSLFAALASVILLHEGIHGAVAWLLGYRPIFGCRPPLVFVTFREKIPRSQFLAIALAPLVLLDLLFAALYAADTLPLYSILCLTLNTLGAAGDVWIALKLIRQPPGSLVQDTMAGIEIWAAEG